MLSRNDCKRRQETAANDQNATNNDKVTRWRVASQRVNQKSSFVATHTLTSSRAEKTTNHRECRSNGTKNDKKNRGENDR